MVDLESLRRRLESIRQSLGPTGERPLDSVFGHGNVFAGAAGPLCSRKGLRILGPVGQEMLAARKRPTQRDDFI